MCVCVCVCCHLYNIISIHACVRPIQFCGVCYYLVTVIISAWCYAQYCSDSCIKFIVSVLLWNTYSHCELHQWWSSFGWWKHPKWRACGDVLWWSVGICVWFKLGQQWRCCCLSATWISRSKYEKIVTFNTTTAMPCMVALFVFLLSQPLYCRQLYL